MRPFLLRCCLKQRARDLGRNGLRRVLFLVRHPPLRWLSVAEAVASAASSASCDERPEHVGVLAVVMTEAELGQVERQVRPGDLVVATDDAALQERPEAIEGLRVDVAADVLARAGI